MFSSNEIRLPSSFSVIHVSVNIKSSVQKDTTLLLFFLSKSPGGYAIFGLPYLLSSFILVCLWCGRTVGRSGGVRSPNFLGWVDLLSYGAPHSRAWTSAMDPEFQKGYKNGDPEAQLVGIDQKA